MRLFWGILTIALVVLVSWIIWGEAWADQFSFQKSIDWLKQAGPLAWLARIGLLASDLVLPIPNTVVMSALGYIYGTMIGGVVATMGLLLGGLLGYGSGRLFTERFVIKMLGERDFAQGRRIFSQRGGWIVALSRSLPILPEVIACVAGFVRMPFGRFAASLICGCIPMGFLFAAVGSLGNVQPGWTLALSLILPGGLWIGACWWRRKW